MIIFIISLGHCLTTYPGLMHTFTNVRIEAQFNYIPGSQTCAIIINISSCPPLSHVHVLKCQSDHYLT